MKFIAAILVLTIFLSPSFVNAQSRPDIVWMRGASGASFVLHSANGLVASDGGITGTVYSGVRIYRADDGVLLRSIFDARLLAFSPDGTRIALGGFGADAWTVRMMDSETGEVIGSFERTGGTRVESASFSPDGQLIAVGTDDGDGAIFRADDFFLGEVVQEHIGADSTSEEHGGGQVLFSPDGRLATYVNYLQNSGYRVLVDVDSNEIVDRFPSTATAGWYEPMAFNFDGSYLAAAGNDGIVVFSTLGSCGGTCLPVANISDVNSASVGFSPDGEHLVGATWTPEPSIHPDRPFHQRIRIWDTQTWVEELNFQAHPDGAFLGNVAVDPCGCFFVTGGDGEIKQWTWDGVLLQKITSFRGTVFPNNIFFQPDGAHLVSTALDTYERATLWDAQTGARTATILTSPGDPRDTSGIVATALSTDGNTLAIGCANCGGTNSLSLVDVASGDPELLLDTGSQPPTFVTFSASGDKLYWALPESGPFSRTLFIGNLATSTLETLNFVQASVDDEVLAFASALSPDGNFFAAANEEGVLVFRLSDKTLVRRLSIPATFEYSPYQLRFSPDSRYLLAAGARNLNPEWVGSIHLWDLNDGTLVYDRTTPGPGVAMAAFEPNGKRFMTGGLDATLRIWKTDTGEQLVVYDEETLTGEGFDPKIRAIRYSPDGRTFAYSRADGTIVVARNPYRRAPSFTASVPDVFFQEQVIYTTSAPHIVTITNNGSKRLTLTVSTTEDFAATDDCVSIRPRETCTISVTHTPTVYGPVPGTLTMVDAANAGNILELFLDGFGITETLASPPVLSFGNVQQGTPKVKTFKFWNFQDVPLNDIEFSVDSGSSDYQITGCPTTLAPHSKCTVSVTWTPSTAPADVFDFLLIDHDAPTSPDVVVMFGRSFLPVTVSSDSIDFGDVAVATPGDSTLTITNNQATVLTFGSPAVSFSGDGASQFTRLSSSSCRATLAAGASCTLVVRFKPAQGGPQSAVMAINHDAGASVAVALQGNGIKPITVSASSVNFGSVSVNTPSTGIIVTLKNKQSIDAELTNIATGGDFVVQNTAVTTCGSTLAAGASCNLSLVMTPTVYGQRTGILAIETNTTEPLLLINLKGKGNNAVTSSTTSLNFGRQAVGTTSSPRAFTLTNHQDAPASYTFTVTGEFSVSSDPCGGSIPARGACQINVTFSPAARASSHTGKVTVNVDTSEKVVVSLKGTDH